MSTESLEKLGLGAALGAMLLAQGRRLADVDRRLARVEGLLEILGFWDQTGTLAERDWAGRRRARKNPVNITLD